MSNRVPASWSNFSDGARAVAAARMPPPRPTESLQAKFDAARFRLHEIVILGMKTWLPADTLNGLRQAEAFRREQVRMHFRMLKDVHT